MRPYDLIVHALEEYTRLWHPISGHVCCVRDEVAALPLPSLRIGQARSREAENWDASGQDFLEKRPRVPSLLQVIHGQVSVGFVEDCYVESLEHGPRKRHPVLQGHRGGEVDAVPIEKCSKQARVKIRTKHVEATHTLSSEPRCVEEVLSKKATAGNHHQGA